MNSKIVAIKQETHDTKTFTIDLEQPLEFKTGQFIMFSIPDVEVSRAYSVSCPGGKKKQVTVTMKIYSDGNFTLKADKLKCGDLVGIKGPFGQFIFDHNIKKDVVLIAAGSGISTLHSILRDIIDNNWEKNVKLIYSVKTIKDIIFYDELKSLNENHNNFNFFITLTDSSDDWSGNFGRLKANILDQEIRNKDCLCFVCGPPDFVKTVVESLKKIGVSKDDIKREMYG